MLATSNISPNQAVQPQIIDRAGPKADSVSKIGTKNTANIPVSRTDPSAPTPIRSNRTDSMACCFDTLNGIVACITSPFSSFSRNTEDSPAGEGITVTEGSCLDRLFGHGSEVSIGNEGVATRSAGWWCTTQSAVTSDGVDVNVDLHGAEVGDIGDGDGVTQFIQGTAEFIGESLATAGEFVGESLGAAAESAGDGIVLVGEGVVAVLGALAEGL